MLFNRAQRRQVRKDVARYQRFAQKLRSGKVARHGAWELAHFDFPVRNTDSIVIPQFSVVMWDTANPDGVVMPGSTGAGAVAGINQSKGIDPTTGAITTGVQVGQSVQVRNQGVSRAIVNGATVLGQPLCAQGTAGKVGTGPSALAGGTVGYGLEAGAGDTDIISVLLNPGLEFALKQLGTFAAPLTANGTANTLTNHAHGLGYIPHVVIIVGVQGTSGPVNLAAAPDATNIASKSPVISATFIAYVA